LLDRVHDADRSLLDRPDSPQRRMDHDNVTRTDPQRTKISDELTHGMHAVEYRPAGGFSISDR